MGKKNVGRLVVLVERGCDRVVQLPGRRGVTHERCNNELDLLLGGWLFPAVDVDQGRPDLLVPPGPREGQPPYFGPVTSFAVRSVRTTAWVSSICFCLSDCFRCIINSCAVWRSMVEVGLNDAEAVVGPLLPVAVEE